MFIPPLLATKLKDQGPCFIPIVVLQWANLVAKPQLLTLRSPWLMIKSLLFIVKNHSPLCFLRVSLLDQDVSYCFFIKSPGLMVQTHVFYGSDLMVLSKYIIIFHSPEPCGHGDDFPMASPIQFPSFPGFGRTSCSSSPPPPMRKSKAACFTGMLDGSNLSMVSCGFKGFNVV